MHRGCFLNGTCSIQVSKNRKYEAYDRHIPEFPPYLGDWTSQIRRNWHRKNNTGHVVPEYTTRNIDLNEQQGIKSTINNWGDDASANSRIATARRRASSLLTNLPIKTKGFSLIKQEFTDAVGRPGSGRLSNQFSCGSSVDFSNEEEHSLYSLWYVTRKNCKINCKKLIMTLQ